MAKEHLTEELELVQKEMERLQLKKEELESKLHVDVKEFARMVIGQDHERKVIYKKFINSISHHFLIHAPTQVGKTSATKDLIEVCCESNVPVVLSCDNKTDQLTQMYTRLSNQLECDDSIALIKAGESRFGHKFQKAFKENKKVIVFCLDNGTQLKKVKEQFAVQMTTEKSKIQKVLLISDEGDIITKDYNIDEIEDEQCESHKEWIRMVTYFSEAGVDVKRVFVTATPENVVYKYKVENILRLRVPPNYIGYEKIKYVSMEPKQIQEILIEEENRRLVSKENGVILYCVDKKIHEGQDPTFVAVCSYLHKSIVNTYNGNGIIARVLNRGMFESALKKFFTLNNKDKKNKKITYNDVSTIETKDVLHIKNMAIRDFYQICKNTGNNVVVTIGMDLIARGISFVSSEKTPDALAATTMIYRPGATLHAVALCQAIGRVTGTARPDLERRLYAPEDVIDTYKKYNENQKQYLDQLSDTKGMVTSEVMEQIELNHKLSRPLDRAKLKIKPLYKDEDHEVISDPDRMKQLIDMWWNADTIIGKILRFVYESKTGVSEEELKNYINDIDAYCGWYNDLGTSGKLYAHVFERTKKQTTMLKKEAVQYIKEHKD